MTEIDETLDLVDEFDNVIGQRKRSQVYQEGLVNFRVVNAFLKNPLGEIWIPRRTVHKKIFPLCLDMSVGGHVEVGETYEEALERELKEGLNLELTEANYKLLGYLTPYKDRISSFMKVYEIELTH